MKLQAHIQKPWKISKELKRLYSPRNIQKGLGLFNRVSQSNFYMVDYHDQKLFAGDTMMPPTPFDFSKEMIEKEGFNLYNRFVSKEELKWLVQINEEAHKVLYSYPEAERWNLEFFYDIIAKTSSKEEIVLRHKLVVYELDKNGNLWLELCHITTSSFMSMVSKACIVNIRTGERFDFIDGKFVASTVTALTPEEITILTHTAKDMPNKQIADALEISESNLKRKRLALFDKLGVKSPAAAIYKATMLKII
jgi:DNA-binding CsgD family transcriptional regulator